MKSGYAATGWKTINGKTYYFNASGKAVSGLNTIKGKQYIFSNDKVLLKGINEVNNIIYKSRLGGTISDTIVKSNIVSFVNENGLSITIQRNDVKEFANVILSEYIDDNTQKWELIKAEDGRYYIKNVFSGMYLSSFSSKAAIIQDKPKTTWSVVKNDNGYLAITEQLKSNNRSISYVNSNL